MAGASSKIIMPTAASPAKNCHKENRSRYAADVNFICHYPCGRFSGHVFFGFFVAPYFIAVQATKVRYIIIDFDDLGFGAGDFFQADFAGYGFRRH
jgi:hypothetical protein